MRLTDAFVSWLQWWKRSCVEPWQLSWSGLSQPQLWDSWHKHLLPSWGKDCDNINCVMLAELQEIPKTGKMTQSACKKYFPSPHWFLWGTFNKVNNHGCYLFSLNLDSLLFGLRRLKTSQGVWLQCYKWYTVFIFIGMVFTVHWFKGLWLSSQTSRT